MALPPTRMALHSRRAVAVRMILLLAIICSSQLIVPPGEVATPALAGMAENGGATPHPLGTTITVMTFNLGDGLATPDDLASYIREIDPDLVALQEVTPEMAETLEADLTDILPYQAVRGLGIPGKALLSRYPIAQAEWLELNPGRHDLLVTVDLAGRPVDVLVAHPPPPELSGGIVQPREGTFEQFDRIVEIAAAAEHPFLLMGDLNETSLQARHDELESIGLQDVFAEVGTGSGDTYPNRVPPLPDFLIRPVVRIDYIWASAQWQPLSAFVGEDIGSDHLPVIAQLTLLDESVPAAIRATAMRPAT